MIIEKIVPKAVLNGRGRRLNISWKWANESSAKLHLPLRRIISIFLFVCFFIFIEVFYLV